MPLLIGLVAIGLAMLETGLIAGHFPWWADLCFPLMVITISALVGALVGYLNAGAISDPGYVDPVEEMGRGDYLW